MIPNGVLIVDLEDKKVTLSNKEMEIIFGVIPSNNIERSGKLERLSEKMKSYHMTDESVPDAKRA